MNCWKYCYKWGYAHIISETTKSQCSYGWGGESINLINEELVKAGFEVIDEGVKITWNPDQEAIQKCSELGKNIVIYLKKNN